MTMSQPTSKPAPEKIYGRPDAAARRTRLREFQAQLVERMQAARSGVDARVNQLGVMIGQTRWLLNLQEAQRAIAVESGSSWGSAIPSRLQLL